MYDLGKGNEESQFVRQQRGIEQLQETSVSGFVREQQGIEQPQETLVQVRLALLRELRSYQNDLDKYVKGYIASLELSSKCAKIRSDLGHDKRRSTKFWEDRQYDFERAFDLAARLDPIKSDFKELVGEFDKALSEAIDATNSALSALQGVDLSNIMATIQRSINTMLKALQSIRTQSEQRANKLLKDIETCTTKIFAPLELLEERKVGKSQERISRSEVNIQQDTQPTRREEQPQIRTGWDAPSSDVRQSR